MADFPAVQTGQVEVSAAFYPGTFISEVSASVGSILSSASMGYVAGPGAIDYVSLAIGGSQLTNPGEFYVHAFDSTSSFLVTASVDGAASQTLGNLPTASDVAHGFLSLPAPYTDDGDFGAVYGFLHERLATPGEFDITTFPVRGIVDAVNGYAGATQITTALWSNELGVSTGDCRLVNVGFGPPVENSPQTTPFGYVVTFGPSSLEDDQDAFYLKRFPEAAFLPALEIPVILAPTSSLVPDLSRFHVIAREDSTLVFYYKVTNSATGFEGTAVMAYDPIRGASGPSFTTTGIKGIPALLFQNLIPADSTSGAVQHPATGEILIALEDSQDTSPLQKLVFAVSRGTGRVADTIQFELDGTNHPNFLGGRWKSICASFEARVNSLGWRNNFTGSSFTCTLGYLPNTFATTHHDFVNTVFDSSITIPLVGEIAVRHTEEAADVGSVEVVGRTSGFFNQRETSRQGYDTDSDLYSVDFAMKFDGVNLTTLLADIGPSGVGTGVVTGPGVISNSRIFQLPSSSSIQMDGSGGEFDATTGLTISFWFNPIADAVAGFRTLVSKLDGLGGTDWAVEWESSTETLRFTVETTSGTVTTTATGVSPVDDTWTDLAFTYVGDDAGDTRICIFALGALLADFSAAVITTIDNHAGTDVFIGGDGITDCPRFSIDDIWIKKDTTTREDVLALMAMGVSTPDGPAHNSHDPSISDRVVHTAVTPYIDAPISGDKPLLSTDALVVQIREVNYQIATAGYDRAILIDMWRRGKNGEMTYLGVIPAPPDANNFTTGGRNNPTLSGGFQDIPARLLFKEIASASASTTYILFFATYHTNIGESTIWRVEFTVGDEGLNAVYTEVGNLEAVANNTTLSPGLDVLLDFNGDEVVFYGIVDEDTGEGSFAAARAADYGTALDAMPSFNLTGLTPDEEFSDYTTRVDKRLDGLVVRTVVDGDGIFKTGVDPAIAQADDFQFYFGVFAPDFSEEHILFGTYNTIFDGAELINNGTFASRGSARIDQPGTGLDPFAPIALVEPPPDLSTTLHPFRHDLIILANAGARSNDSFKRGQGGLSVYKGRQDATSWKRVATVSHDTCVSGGGPMHGADIAIIAGTLLDPTTSASVYTNENAEDFYLQISRPGPDGSDRAASLYLTSTEAADSKAEWDIVTAGSIKPVLHPSNEPYVCVVEDYEVNLRRWSTDRTGAQIIKGSFTQAMPAPHWAAPSTQLDTPGSEIFSVVPFQGQSFSPLQNILRGWQQVLEGDPSTEYNSVVPATMSPNFRTGDKTEPLTPADQIVASRIVQRLEADHYTPVGIVDVTLTAAEQETIAPPSLIAADDDERAGYGRYILLRSNSGVITIETYDSFYFDEFGVQSIAAYDPVWRTAWEGTFDIPESVATSMRAVVVQGRTFVYFIFGTSLSSRILVVELPSAIDLLAGGSGSSTADPGLVEELSFVATDRMYAVALNAGGTDPDNDRVVLYVGNAESSAVRNTYAVVHDPIANETVRPEKVVVSGQSPFARSYAATTARVDYELNQTLIALEPAQSREGSGGQAYYGAVELGLGSELPTDLFSDGTGSIWNLVSLVSDGYHLFDTISITPKEMKPYFGGFDSTRFGGNVKRHTKPHFLARLTDPRDSDDAVNSTEIYMSAMYSEINNLYRGFGYHLNRITTATVLTSGDPEASFGFGEDQVASNSLIGQTVSAEFDNVYSTLVPIGFNIEFQGGIRHGDNYYSNLGGLSGLQLNWELQDDSAIEGKPSAEGGSDLQAQIADVTYGTKVLWMGPNVTFVVGWFRGNLEVGG